VPPKKIEFIGHHSGSRIERKENENLEISCKVSDSKPAAEIVWLRNNIPLVGRFIYILVLVGRFYIF